MQHAAALAGFVAASALALNAIGADAAAVEPVSSTFCGSAATTIGIAKALLASDPQAGRAALEQTAVEIARRSNEVVLRRRDSGRTASAPWIPPAANVCPAYPAGAIVLGAANVVPGSTFAAIDAAYAYQNAHAWPTKHPAHPELSGTSVYVEQRGAFSFVSFVDDPRLAPGWDTCNGQEFYRVSPGSFVVLPYRGCLVSGDDIPLPRMDQLPG